jgi:hypothetical protein
LILHVGCKVKDYKPTSYTCVWSLDILWTWRGNLWTDFQCCTTRASAKCAIVNNVNLLANSLEAFVAFSSASYYFRNLWYIPDSESYALGIVEKNCRLYYGELINECGISFLICQRKRR